MTRSGRRVSDPRPPSPANPSSIKDVIESLLKRVTASEKALGIQFERIAQLQVSIDRMLNVLHRRKR